MGRFAGRDLPEKIVMFSTAEWDAPLWTNKQQIAVRLANDFQVIYVEPTRPVGAAAGRSLLTGRHWTDRGVTVYRPPAVLPFGAKIWPVNCANASLVASDLNRVLTEKSFARNLVWCYPPTCQPLAAATPHVLSCYDCVDEYSAFPGAWAITTKRMEKALIQHVDVVFTTAESLYQAKRRFNPRTYFVPNVADFEHFHQATRFEAPRRVREMPRPLIGFVGALNYKLDAQLLEALFRLRPNWSFLFIGPDRGFGVDRFLGHRNVHFWGRKTVDELPAIMAGFDACIIPYHINRYTEGVLPLKFFEYLATGKPVVSTPIPELRKFEPMIDLAGTAADFARAVERRLEVDQHREQRIALARDNSWEHRIGRMLTILEDVFADKREVES
jgi:glycosyltransferase involved in cell wall biosynthesis